MFIYLKHDTLSVQQTRSKYILVCQDLQVEMHELTERISYTNKKQSKNRRIQNNYNLNEIKPSEIHNETNRSKQNRQGRNKLRYRRNEKMKNK